jgi:hypothetical protein
VTDDIEAVLAELESWENEVDFPLRQAQKVLEHMTAHFLTDESPDPEDAAVLAEAWRDLSSDWQHRQSHEVDLQYGIEQLGTEDAGDDGTETTCA